MSFVAENIVVSFSGRDVLQGATIRADPGRITGLLGRNGCGKSTLLKVMFGTQPATDKMIQFNGKRVRYPYTQAGLVNYLPQFSFFPKGLKVAKVVNSFNVDQGKMLHYFPAIEPELGRTFAELSGGMERLISALVLIYAPTKFTLLDEPFTHIMPLHLDVLKTVLLEERKNKGIILTDHMYRHLVDISDTIYLINEGRAMLIRSKEELAFHNYIRPDTHL